MPVITRRSEFRQLFVDGSARDREVAAKTFHLLLRVQDPRGVYPVRQREHGDWIVDITDSRQRRVDGVDELFSILGVVEVP
jgi:hypothetical protein